jgi:cysteine desulfurase
MLAGKTIYLDYQATTPIEREVQKVMTQAYQDGFANPHSVGHILGQQSAQDVDDARTSIERYLGADEEEVIFTSGATESNNQAIASVVMANKDSRKRVLVSGVEHKCVKNAAFYYASTFGCKVEEIPVLADGMIDVEAYKTLLAEDVLMVCIMAVNNEIGTINDIPLLTTLAHEVGALFHCDAAQAPEAMQIDVKAWDVDLLSLSGHKVYGPKGIGVLYMKNTLQAELPPLIHGGGQQFGMRSGTVPTPLCVGFAKALEITQRDFNQNSSLIFQLKQRLLNNIQAMNVEFNLNGNQTYCHPGNLNIEFVDVNSTQLLDSLQPDVAASTGSACNSEMVLPSHVLKALGLSDEQATSSIRFSLGRFNDEQQIDLVASLLEQRLKTLRKTA